MNKIEFYLEEVIEADFGHFHPLILFSCGYKLGNKSLKMEYLEVNKHEHPNVIKYYPLKIRFNSYLLYITPLNPIL